MSGALAMHFSNNYKTPRPGLAAPAAICQLADVPVDVLRFRPTLVVKSLVEQPFVEGEWVEAVLQIGGVRVRVDRRDSRCVVVNLEPLTGEKQRGLKVHRPTPQRGSRGLWQRRRARPD